MYNRSRINNKSFDVSYICDRYNKNQKLLLEDFARDYGITREELISRMSSSTDPEERKRAKAVIKQDDRRRRGQKGPKQKKTVVKVEEPKKEKSMKKSSFETERDSIIAKMEEVKKKLASSRRMVVSLERLESESNKSCMTCNNEVIRLTAEMEELEDKLKQAKKQLAKLEEISNSASKKHDEDVLNLNNARLKFKIEKENLKHLEQELAELENHRIFLVAPTFNLSNLPVTCGRFISSVELDGVDYEQVDTDANNMGLAKVGELMKQSGITDIEQLAVAYDFAWLVCLYMSQQEYDVHVLNDDEHIQKLIDWMLS